MCRKYRPAHIEVRQAHGLIRVPSVPLRNLAAFFMEQLGRFCPGLDLGCISILVTDDEGIAGINREHFGRSGITDVISFRYQPAGAEKAYAGDIAINLEEAMRGSSPVRGWNAAKELALYLAHGFDHLSGADDATPAQRRTMRRRELGWLKLADREGLLRGLAGRWSSG